MVEETAAIDKRQKITGSVGARTEVIDHPLSVRQEGDAVIIPVVEEVRITKQQITKHEPQTVTLRRQNVVLDRLSRPHDGKLD